MGIDKMDFRYMDALEAIEKIKALQKPELEPLVLWISRGYAFDRANQNVRISIADGEREVEKLVKA